MPNDITMFRVRKDFHDIGSQKGAFFTLEAAIITAKKFGLNVYDNKGKRVFPFK